MMQTTRLYYAFKLGSRCGRRTAQAPVPFHSWLMSLAGVPVSMTLSDITASKQQVQRM